MEFDDAKAQGLIEIMGAETDEKFMSHVMAMVNDRESMAKVADTFHMVYTPFHGCGWKLVPEALRGLGVKHLHCVPEQMVLDGSFPTVVSPNPENPEGFYLAIQLADKVGADFILGTDPDSDRVGIMVRGASLLPQDHRHHGDGPEGGRGQWRHLLRYLHRLQVHGGEEEPAGVSGAGPCDHEL